MKTNTLHVMGVNISFYKIKQEDYISLTDMVKKNWDEAMIYSWLRNRNTLEFIWSWEELYNSDFKGNEFETFNMRFFAVTSFWSEWQNHQGFYL